MMKLSGLIYKFSSFLGTLVPLIMGLAVFIFMYGLLVYMMNVGDEGKRKESIQYITAGLIGLFIMVSLWGLVYIVSGTFGFTFGIPKIL